MNSISKLILGTVQFGLSYGINNEAGQVSCKEVDTILSFAHNAGIEMLDTSYAYGSSEAVLGNVFRNHVLNFDIISKYPKSEKDVVEVFEESLRRLGQNELYGYMVHHFDYYKVNPRIWDRFKRLKEERRVDKIGFSLYTTDQLDYLLDNNVSFDLLQIPYNIFDRQFEAYFGRLKELNVEIHTRSVFLQGLFFKDVTTLSNRLLPLKGNLEQLHFYCGENSIQVEQLAINYVVNNKYVDKVLIGVDSVDQLKSNIDVLDYNINKLDIDFVESLHVEKKELLNPVNWK